MIRPLLALMLASAPTAAAAEDRPERPRSCMVVGAGQTSFVGDIVVAVSPVLKRRVAGNGGQTRFGQTCPDETRVVTGGHVFAGVEGDAVPLDRLVATGRQDPSTNEWTVIVENAAPVQPGAAPCVELVVWAVCQRD